MSTFQLQIVTQEKVAYEGEATSIIVPGELGYFGVLANHAPLLAALGEGKLTVRSDSGTTESHLTGGFIEVQNNQATILADNIEGEIASSSEE